MVCENVDFANINYIDKYHLASVLTNTALAAQLNCLEFLGFTANNIEKILFDWGRNRTGTSPSSSLCESERCRFTLLIIYSISFLSNWFLLSVFIRFCSFDFGFCCLVVFTSLCAVRGLTPSDVAIQSGEALRVSQRAHVRGRIAAPRD
jgi:hypothetical protein